MTRRTLLRMAAAAPVGAYAGTLKTKPSAGIASSRLSVNFGIGHSRMDEEHTRLALPFARDLGVKHARITAAWSGVEPTEGKFDFAWLDLMVDGLRSAGVQPWLTFGLGNKVYAPQAPAEVWSPLLNERSRNGWIRYVRQVAERYKGRVSSFEVWNEPEFDRYWGPGKPDAAAYTELVKITAENVRRIIPNAMIIGGSLTVMPMLLDFLEACIAHGMGKYIDRLSYHPYRAVPEANYDTEVAAMRAIVAKSGKNIPLWMGEVGCPSGGGGGALVHLEWDETRQAKWLLRRVMTDLRLDLDLISWFMMLDGVDRSEGTVKVGNSKGLIATLTGKPKQAYFAYQRLCSLFDAGTVRTDRLVHFAPTTRKNQIWNSQNEPVPVPTNHAVYFERAGRPLVAWWQPAVLQEPFTPARTSLLLWCGKGRTIERPVLIDPLSGEVRRLDAPERTDGFLRFNPMTVMDYPLLLTDESVIAS